MAIHGFCTGDVEFLKEKVYSLLPERQRIDPKLLLGWEDDWKEFLQFVHESDRLAIYGAGDAAKVFRKGRKLRLQLAGYRCITLVNTPETTENCLYLLR